MNPYLIGCEGPLSNLLRKAHLVKLSNQVTTTIRNNQDEGWYARNVFFEVQPEWDFSIQ